MKLRVSNVIYIFLMIGAMTMLSPDGYSEDTQYQKYSSKDPQIGLTIDFVSGWISNETRSSARVPSG